MARVLSRTAVSLAGLLGESQPRGILLGRRGHHTRRPGAAAALEVLEIEAAGTSKSADAMRRRLEEAIDGAMARMSEPEWAPFRPGTSYYAPPRSAGAALGLLELVTRGGVMGSPLPRALSSDEARAVASASRGYPCSTYFIDGHFPDAVDGSRQDEDPAEEE